MCLYYSPERRGQKSAVVVIYAALLAISIVPVIFEPTLPPPGNSPERDRRWFAALFSGVHPFFISPIITALGIARCFHRHEKLFQGQITER